MTRHTAQVLIGGPALVERALGRRLTKEELGGAKVHMRSGVIDNVAEDEEDAFRREIAAAEDPVARRALCDWMEWSESPLRQQLGPRSYTFRP